MANQYHGTLTPPRIAPSRPFKEETEVSLYPTSPSWQAAAPHGCLVSLLIALSGWRSWRQKTSRFEKRGKIRSTELFSCQGASEVGFIASSPYNGHFFCKLAGPLKNFFEFFSDGISGVFYSRKCKPIVLCISQKAHSTTEAFQVNIVLRRGETIYELFFQ